MRVVQRRVPERMGRLLQMDYLPPASELLWLSEVLHLIEKPHLSE